MFKSLSLKLAVPAIVFTIFLIPLAHQINMMMAGVGMTLEHKLSYGRWWDKGKLVCHGKAGVLLLVSGSSIALSGMLY